MRHAESCLMPSECLHQATSGRLWTCAWAGKRSSPLPLSRDPKLKSRNRAIKRGYYIGANDNFDLSTELMNENEAPSEVYVVITYEYLPGLPHDFHATKQIWLDVGGCTGSGQPAKPHSSFELTMERPWISPFSGYVTYIGGHVHDGGTHVEVLKNDVVVCDCVATYGGDPEFVEGDHGMGMQHISRISTCEGNFPVEKGDRWSIMAYYNTSEHMPMGDGQGGLEPVMGIAMVYAVADQ